MNKDVVKLGIDLYKGTTGEFSKEQSAEALRSALLEINGGKIPYKDFRRNKIELFEIIEEMLQILVVEGITNQFDQFAEVRNLNWGDTNVFTVANQDLFKVAVISDGNNNLRRQRLDNGEFSVPVKTKGVKIYDELYRFLSGRIDWVEMVNRVAKSYNVQLATEVYDAIYNSFSALTAPYALSSAFSEASLIDMAQHVEAATGASVSIYGTKKALSKITTAQYSDNMIDKKNNLGFLGTISGYEMREIKQAHKPGTQEFAINDSFLLIVPNLDDKFVKIVNEGDALIQETQGGTNADQSLEYVFTMKSGIAVVPAAKYGVYRIAN